jgi:hypothetical protein
MKLLKASVLILLAASLSFADLDYNSTLGTNSRNSGPKVAVAVVLSAGVFWLIYWFAGGGKENHEMNKEEDAIHYHTEGR